MGPEAENVPADLGRTTAPDSPLLENLARLVARPAVSCGDRAPCLAVHVERLGVASRIRHGNDGAARGAVEHGALVRRAGR